MKGRKPGGPPAAKGARKPAAARSGAGKFGSGKPGRGKPDQDKPRQDKPRQDKWAKGKSAQGTRAAPRTANAPKPSVEAAPKKVAASAKSSGASLDVRTFTVGPDDEGIRLDRWFKRHLPDVSFALVSRWARTGQLRVDGARATPGDRIAAGQSIRVPPAEAKAPVAAPRRVRPALSEDEETFAQDMVIHRDPQALVINKPPGLATQGGTKTIEHVDGLLDALCFEREERPKLVHRLDKDTSGALLLARSARAAAYFAKSFSSRTARKVYWAVVLGVPSIDDGFIDLPIAKQPGTGGEKMHVDQEEGLPARSRYRVIERAGNRAAWVELQPHTGRTHQLRVHMAAIGHPIVGDGKYGGKDAFLTGAISRKMHLHARRIRIDHPDGGKVDVKAEPPTHFIETFESLGFDFHAGDLPLDEEIDRTPTREDEKRVARQHAKQVRKGRRGERRSRASQGKR
jgi:23S rRNA pseudouridine955/2504/2580 synthase